MPAATTPGSIVLLTRLARQVYRESSEEILGMTLKQFGVLNWLPDEGGIAQQELGVTLCLDPNNLVLLLNSLEDEGWIERRRDPADRRRPASRRPRRGPAPALGGRGGDGQHRARGARPPEPGRPRRPPRPARARSR